MLKTKKMELMGFKRLNYKFEGWNTKMQETEERI